MPTFASGYVSTSVILDGAVTTAKLADNAVTNVKVADDAIANAEVVSTAAILSSKLSGVTTPSSTDTFTNKTFNADGVGNSITNIENADIKAAAAISSSKLATVAVAQGGTGLTALGTGLQVLRTNAGATALEYATAAAGQEIKVATATWTTNFTTTSTIYVDVTSATVTLSGLTAGTTYDLFAIAFTDGANNTSGQVTDINITINGTNSGEASVAGQAGGDAGTTFCSPNGIKVGVTGATSYIAKLQAKVTANIASINAQLRTNRIILFAFGR